MNKLWEMNRAGDWEITHGGYLYRIGATDTKGWMLYRKPVGRRGFVGFIGFYPTIDAAEARIFQLTTNYNSV